MMTFFDFVRWDRLSDGIELLLCAVILVCLVHNKLKYRRLLPDTALQGKPPVFSQEVLLQTLRQQTEQALASIRAAVEVEQNKLQQLLGATDAPRPIEERAAAEIAAENEPFRLGDGDSAAPGLVRSRLAGLPALAARGLTTRQMAAQSQLPAGEIELALKLHRARF
jgi:hypothetical protein